MRLWRLPPAMGVGFFPAAAVVNPTNPDSDTYWDKVISLAHFDNQAGAQIYNDTKNVSWSVGDSAGIDTSFKKFGAASLLLPGNGSGYLQTASDSRWNFGTNDFTLEMWIYWKGNTGALISRRDGVAEGWAIQLEDNGLIALRAKINETWNDKQIASSAGAIKKETWQHVALTRKGDQWDLWVDGVSAVSRNISGAINDTSRPIRLGQATSVNYNENPYYGYIDDLRVTNGQARYTSAFAPPTVAFPNQGQIVATDPYYGKVIALLHMDEANFTDQKGHTISSPTSKYPTSVDGKFRKAAQFDGNGSTLLIPAAADLSLLRMSYTVELWVKATQASDALTARRILAPGQNTNSYPFQLALASESIDANKLWWDIKGTGDIGLFDISSSSTINDGLWHHVALVCDAQISASPKTYTYILFVDGVEQGRKVNQPGDVNDSYPPMFDTEGILLGGRPDASANAYFAGAIDELRITAGVARYTADFAVPTAAFPNSGTAVATDPYWDKVMLLAHFDAVGANSFTEAKGKTVQFNQGSGNTSRLDAAAKVFGTAGLLMDGTSEGMIAADDSGMFAFGTEPFTLEFFLRLNASSVGMGLLDTGVANGGWQIFKVGDNDSFALYLGGTKLASLPYPSGIFSTFRHVAIQRIGSLFQLFIDGVSQAKANIPLATSFPSTTGQIRIGSELGTTYKLNGAMDELRITKGVARYQGDFVSPTSAYPEVQGTPPVTTDPRVYGLRGTAGLTQGIAAYSDDAFGGEFFTPFSFMLSGIDLSATKVFGSSNSYLTVGAGYTEYANLGSGSPPVPKILVGAADRSWYQTWSGSVDGGNGFTFRFVGNTATDNANSSPDTATHLWEITFYKDGTIVLVTGRLNGSETATSTGYSGIASASTELVGVQDLRPNSAYLFTPGDDQGNTWRVEKKR